MGITGGQFGPGIADSDHGFTLKFKGGKTLALHPGAVNESILTLLSKPMLTSEFRLHDNF
jgi:hypothetical protein